MCILDWKVGGKGARRELGVGLAGLAVVSVVVVAVHVLVDGGELL